MKNFIIRKAIHSDAEGIIVAHRRSIREICTKDYTPEQIEAWSGRKFKPVLWQAAMDRDHIWVIDGDGLVFGFGHFAVMDETVGELMGLYLVPEAKGLGLGKRIFSDIISTARQNGLKKIQLHSTTTARSFYESMGFYQSGSDTTIEMQGVDIPCYPMEYIIT